jgi:hypothetical protein
MMTDSLPFRSSCASLASLGPTTPPPAQVFYPVDVPAFDKDSGLSLGQPLSVGDVLRAIENVYRRLQAIFLFR